MNSFFLFFIPSLITFGILMGVYKVFVEDKIQAKENVMSVLTPYHQQTQMNRIRQNSDQLIRQRNKDENSFWYKLDLKMEQANYLISPKEFLAFCIVSGCIGVLLVMVLLHSLPFAILVSIPAAAFPYLVLLIKIKLRLKKAGELLPDMLDTMVSSFRSGYGFTRSCQVIAENYQDPWGTECGKMNVELNLGLTLEETLANLKRRIPIMDVEMFASAVMIQKETGGNLAEIFGNLSQTCRDRMKLFRRIQSITAQGKLSACIVSCVPFFIMGVMFLAVNESVMAFITNPIGVILIGIFALWMCFGFHVLYKLVQIEV